jgi:hypothetical protein
MITDIFVQRGLWTHNGTRFAGGNPVSITFNIRLNLPLLIPRKKALITSCKKMMDRFKYPNGGNARESERIN